MSAPLGMIPLPYRVLAGMIAVIAVFVAGVTLGIKWHAGEVARSELARKQGWADALEATAKEIAKIEVKQVTIKRAVEREVKTNTFYQECKNTDPMMRAINGALRGGK